MNSTCVAIRIGEEYVLSAPMHPIVALLHEIRLIMIDRFGVHLRRIGLYGIVVPKASRSSQCLSLPNNERPKVLRVEGASSRHNKALIISSFPIEGQWAADKNCRDICHGHSHSQCVCVRHSELRGKDRVIFHVSTSQMSRMEGQLFFNSVGSVIQFDRFMLFDRVVKLKPTQNLQFDVTLAPSTPVVPGGHSSEYVLINAVDGVTRMLPVIHLEFTVNLIRNATAPNVTVSVQSGDFTRPCALSQQQPQCIMRVLSRNDHFVRIKNDGDAVATVGLAFSAQSSVLGLGGGEFKPVHRGHNNHDYSCLFTISATIGCVLVLVCLMMQLCFKRSARKRALQTMRNVRIFNMARFKQLQNRIEAEDTTETAQAAYSNLSINDTAEL